MKGGSYRELKALELFDKQQVCMDALINPENTHIKQILYGGAAGSGKSRLIATWLLHNCLNYPESRWLLGRKNLNAIIGSTWVTMKDLMHNYLGLLEEVDYHYNGKDYELNFKNGSMVKFMSLDYKPSDPDYDYLGSYEFTGAAIDEVQQVTEDCLKAVTTRLRWKNEELDVPAKILMTCNPSNNWVKKQFYIPWRDGNLPPYRAFIPAELSDNIFASKDYVENMHALTGQMRKRMLESDWDYAETDSSLCNSTQLSRIFSNNKVTEERNMKTYISADIAQFGSDKAVIMAWKGLHCIEIHSFPTSSTVLLENKIKALMAKHNVLPQHVVIDANGVGAGIPDHIPGSIRFLAQSAPIEDASYRNLSTQCWYTLAQKVNMNNILIDPFYEDELGETILEELQAVAEVEGEGALRCSSKADIRAKIGRSPDYGDCLMMRMYFEIKPKLQFFVV